MPAHRLIIVDGYNVIHRAPQLRPGGDRTLRESRDKLVNLLSWVFGAGDAHFIVVFDGAEGVMATERQMRVDVRFSRPPQTADDLIRSIVEDRVDRDRDRRPVPRQRAQSGRGRDTREACDAHPAGARGVGRDLPRAAEARAGPGRSGVGSGRRHDERAAR